MKLEIHDGTEDRLSQWTWNVDEELTNAIAIHGARVMRDGIIESFQDEASLSISCEDNEQLLLTITLLDGDISIPVNLNELIYENCKFWSECDLDHIVSLPAKLRQIADLAEAIITKAKK